jgi:predicted GTPase
MHVGSRALAAGADYVLLGPKSTMIKANIPVIAVCAVRTGCGKSQTTRAVAQILKDSGKKVGVVRHPMPYGNLVAQRAQRFETYDDLVTADCTIEEREEYEPHLAQGSIVFAGIDYGEILKMVQVEADVVLWDGGNNDFPFFVPDVHITVTDPLRVGHETRYHPGEANLRMADIAVVNKIDSADEGNIETLIRTIETVNPAADVVLARSPISIEDGLELAGKRVLVVEDGPTLTHGEMAYGAGVVAAQRAGVAELVDPRPWVAGTLKEVFELYPHMGPLLPAMGYSEDQRRALADTINASDADAVLIATPIDLRKICDLHKPAYRATYELEPVPPSALAEALTERLRL